MKVISENGKIKVESAYNKVWVARAHELNGKWKSPYWVFDEKHEDLVRTSLMDIYGEDGRPAEKITVDITLSDDDIHGKSELSVAGVVVARRLSRDSSVKMMNGAILVSGGFPYSGGSRNYPMLGGCKEGNVVRVEIPKAKLEEVQEDFQVSVYEQPKINKDALLSEKEELVKRLAEIEALLAQ